MLRTVVAVPTALCGAVYWKGRSHLAISNQVDERLVYVHVYHRHGERSPDRSLYQDIVEEGKIWTPILAKQYYSYQEMENAINDNNSNRLNNWSNVNLRLNGSYLKPINLSVDDNKDDDVTNDAHYKSVWIGQLSENGANQLQHFGEWLRSRYVQQFGYLPSTYQSSYKLHIESTNYKRTIFSVDSLLNGLYGNHQRHKGDAIIPIHIDKDTNHLLFVDFKKCKNYYKKLYWSYNPRNPECVFKTENMEHDILEIQNKLRDFYGGSRNMYIASPLKTRLMNNIDLPTNVNKEDCMKYVEYIYGFFMNNFKRNDMLRISNGVLFGKLLDSMKSENGKFVISSGHDYTVYPIICSLLRHCKDQDIIQKHGKWPKYADNIIFEVWELPNKCNNTHNDKRFVRILHNKNVLPINGEEFISLTELENMWRDLIISPQTLWNSECCC